MIWNELWRGRKSQIWHAVKTQSRNVTPSLSNHNSVIKPFVIMPNYGLVVLFTYNQYKDYQEK